MFLIFIISLSIILYFICMEFVAPTQSSEPLTGACPDCSEEVVSGWLVCPHCKAVLRQSCRACGKVHDAWTHFCPWCRHDNETVEA